MASLDTLLDFVMPKTPHLAVDVARMELRQAAIRFCRKSKFDRRNLAVFDTVAEQAFYTLTPPTDTAISEVLKVVLDGEIPGLSPLRADEIPADAETFFGEPAFYSSSENGTKLQLINAPCSVQTVFVKVALEPSKTATVINDDLASRYGEEIACGALESLLIMPKMPWSDPSLAAYYKSRFDTAVLDAKDEADKGFTGASTRTRCVFGLR